MRLLLSRLVDPMRSASGKLTATEHVLTAVIGTFFAAGLDSLARPLVRLARWHGRDLPVSTGRPAEKNGRPVGPVAVVPRHECALLLFVPRSLKSLFIDDLTGAYGYSHIAIDVGEVDVPTRKPVMTEATLGDVVHRSYQDAYGDRPYVRVPIGPLEVDCARLRECVNDKLGEPYGDKEALTWGAIDDPAKQICSDLAANCLPDSLRLDIAQTHRRGKVRPFAVSVHRLGHRQPRVFVSPNGFAEYFGVPPGKEIDTPNVIVPPGRPGNAAGSPVRPPLTRRSMLAVMALTLFASMLIGILVRRQHDMG